MTGNRVGDDQPKTTRYGEPLKEIQVKNINNPKDIQVFQILEGATITGNTVKYEIKADGVYVNGKKLDNNIIELTRYQVAAIEALAEGDGSKEGSRIIDWDDRKGAAYAADVDKKLQAKKSEYVVATDRINYNKDEKSADSTEHGIVFAYFEKKSDQNKEEDPPIAGQLIIDLDPSTRRTNQLQEKSEEKSWWQFWK